nr:endospore germination permease [uncultured Caproiciproducens sp.]
MTNHKITGKQIQCILLMYWTGSLVAIAISPDSGQDSWISSLLAAVMVVPLFFLYIRLISLYPGKNLFEILLQIFGNIFGRILILIYVCFIIHLGSMVMKIFSSFIHILNMPETPEPAILFFVVLLSIWTAKSGPENIGRMSKYTWPILAVSVALTFVIAIKDMNFDNLKPIMGTDFKTLLNGAFTTCMLPLGEGLICLSFFSSFDLKANTTGIFFKALILILGVLLIVNIRNILVLGMPSATMYYFSSYETVGIISIGEFFTRIEVLIGLNLMLAGFIKVSVCVYSASLGLAKLLNVPDQKPYVVPCGLLMVTISGMLYANTVEMIEFTKIYRIYAIPFLIILPIIIWIGAEIQTKIKSIGSSSPQKKQVETKSPPASE